MNSCKFRPPFSSESVVSKKTAASSRVTCTPSSCRAAYKVKMLQPFASNYSASPLTACQRGKPMFATPSSVGIAARKVIVSGIANGCSPAILPTIRRYRPCPRRYAVIHSFSFAPALQGPLGLLTAQRSVLRRRFCSGFHTLVLLTLFLTRAIVLFAPHPPL
jgi:hypothetical protein